MGYARDFIGAMESVFDGVAKRGVKVIANAGGVNPRGVRRRGARCGDEARPSRQGAHRRRDRRRPSAAARRAARRRPRAGQHGHRRAAQHRARSRAVGQRLHRLDADRRGAARRARTSSSPAARPTRRSRWRRCATNSAGPPTTGTGSPPASSPATSSSAARRAPAATACTTGAAFLISPTSAIPIVEARGRRNVRHHQASGHRRSRVGADGHRAARVRDGRPARVHHARRRRRLHEHSVADDGANRVRVYGITGGPPTPTSSRCRSPIARASRPSARSCTPGPTRSRRRSWPTACCASGSTGSGCASTRSSPSSSARPRRTVRSPAMRRDPPEVQFRIGVRGEDKAAVERFTREIVPLVLNGPPSVTGFAGGRPKVEEIVAYWPALIDKRVGDHRRPHRGGSRHEGPSARHRARAHRGTRVTRPTSASSRCARRGIRCSCAT